MNLIFITYFACNQWILYFVRKLKNGDDSTGGRPTVIEKVPDSQSLDVPDSGTSSGTRRTRFDTNQTVIAADDEYHRPESDNELDELEMGPNEAVEDSEDNGISDTTGVALVSMWKEDSSVDIYPATIFEFTDYLKRGKITALSWGI